MTNAFALRCDFDWNVDRDRMSDWLSSNSDGFLVVYEEVAEENPHVHAIIYSSKNIDALRKSFKRAFEEKRGNAAYSLKPCTGDVDDYIAYICKGVSVDQAPRVVCQQGFEFSAERVKEAHERYWDVNARLRAGADARAAMKGNMVEAIEKMCRDEGVRAYDRKGIARVYIREMKRMRKAINIFAARAVVNGVVVCLDDDNGGATEDIVSSIANL